MHEINWIYHTCNDVGLSFDGLLKANTFRNRVDFIAFKALTIALNVRLNMVCPISYVIVRIFFEIYGRLVEGLLIVACLLHLNNNKH